MLRLLLERRTLRDESRYEQDGGDVRTGVDEQHACRTNGADEDAREHRARKQRRPGGRLEERVGFRDLLLPFTEELGDDHLLGGEVRGREAAEAERDR